MLGGGNVTDGEVVRADGVAGEGVDEDTGGVVKDVGVVGGNGADVGDREVVKGAIELPVCLRMRSSIVSQISWALIAADCIGACPA